MFRRHLPVAAFVVAISLTLLPTPGGAQDDATPEVHEALEVLRIDGRGHGHGVGLSQWGAHTMATRGSTAAEILSTFYPGTRLGTAGGEVAVRIDDRSLVHLSFPGGGEIRAGRDGADIPGFPVRVPAGAVVTVRTTASGFEVAGGVVGQSSTAVAFQTPGCPLPVLCPRPSSPTTTTTAPPDSTVPTTESPSPPAEGPATSPVPVWAVPDGAGTVTSVDRGRNYRGVVQVSSGGTVTNHVDVEDYLRGMIEVPGHWPAAAVQAQTIAARTFALRAMVTAGSICDTDACQVYLGTARESSGLDAAVAATRGTVVYYGNGLAATFFSASSGGVSATPREGFGNDTDVPYLQAVEHPDADPQPWTLDVPLREIADRFGYAGTVSDVRVDATGPSGRALAMTIVGDAGDMALEPTDFASRLDLRSTLYTVEVTMSDGSPVPSETTAPATTVADRAAGVQAPAVGEAVVVAVPPPRGGGGVAWPWTAAATASIAAVVGAGFVGLRTTGTAGFTPSRRRRQPAGFRA